MRYLKLFEDSSDDERLWHHISYPQYSQGWDNVITISESEASKIKSIILNQNPKYKATSNDRYVKASIVHDKFTNTQFKVYLLPDEWYLVSVTKEFRLIKDFFYYKCDTIEGLVDLLKWI